MDRLRNVFFYLKTHGDYPPSIEELDADLRRKERKSLCQYAKTFIYDEEHDTLNRRGRSGDLRKVLLSREEIVRVLSEVHGCGKEGGHLGQKKTQSKISERFYWLSITKDVNDWIATCPECQLQAQVKTMAPDLKPIHTSEPWQIVGVDLITMRPSTEGYRYILTATCLFSKWVVAEPIINKSAKSVFEVLQKMMYIYGPPKHILTDRGSEFNNELLNELIFKKFGVRHLLTSAYHPQTNGQDEKTNHTIKSALGKLMNKEQNNWPLYIDQILWSIRSSPSAAIKMSPYEALFGRKPNFFCELDDTPLPVYLPENLGAAAEERVQMRAVLNTKIKEHNEEAKGRLKKQYHQRKMQGYKCYEFKPGQAVLRKNMRKKRGGGVATEWVRGYTVDHVTDVTLTVRDSQGNALKPENRGHFKPLLEKSDEQFPTISTPETDGFLTNESSDTGHLTGLDHGDGDKAERQDTAGIINKSSNCWLNSTLQSLLHVLKETGTWNTLRGKTFEAGSLCNALKKEWCSMVVSKTIDPIDLQKYLQEQGFTIGLEYDCHEVLIMSLHELAKEGLFTPLHLSNERKCLGPACGTTVSTQGGPSETIYIWSLPMSKAKTIQGSLNCMVDWDTVTDDNTIYCLQCQKKEAAVMRCMVLNFPPLLVLQLKRFVYLSTDLLIKDQSELEIDEELKLTHGDDSAGDCFYKLISVQCHEGSMQHGHYWTMNIGKNYIKSRNDEESQDFPIDVLLTPWVKRTCYILYYMRTTVRPGRVIRIKEQNLHTKMQRLESQLEDLSENPGSERGKMLSETVQHISRVLKGETEFCSETYHQGFIKGAPDLHFTSFGYFMVDADELESLLKALVEEFLKPERRSLFDHGWVFSQDVRPDLKSHMERHQNKMCALYYVKRVLMREAIIFWVSQRDKIPKAKVLQLCQESERRKKIALH